MTQEKEKATCRNCGKEFIGTAYMYGHPAYQRVKGVLESVKVNFYGGFVCSRTCDEAASRELESSMPGNMGRVRSLSSPAQLSIKKNWSINP